jgi:hypothetical protein
VFYIRVLQFIISGLYTVRGLVIFTPRLIFSGLCKDNAMPGESWTLGCSSKLVIEY